MATTAEALKRAKESSGQFISLKDDGDKAVFAFVDDEVEVEENAWVDGAYVAYTKEHEAKKVAKTPRFAVNVFDRESKTLKILRVNAATFETMITMRDKYGVDGTAFEILRKGKKNDTKVQYLVSPERLPLTPDEKALIKTLPKHDLKRAREEDTATDMHSHDKTNGSANGAKAPAAADTIDAATSTALVGRLKQHPRAKIDAFLAQFKIAKTRDLKLSDLAAATALIDSYEGKPAAADSSDEFA